MISWAKIKFYYDTMLGSAGSALTASSTASGDYSVNYICNMMETNRWMAANTTTPMYITYDAGSGNTKTADYLIILGHNLHSANAAIEFQSSSDNFGSDITSITGGNPSADTVLLYEFAQTAPKRYYRLKINPASGSLSAPPYMAICVWGMKTELDYADSSFDPYQQEAKANVNLSQGGYVAGLHTMYTERQLSLTFEDADSTLYGKIKSWWETNGLKNFFVAWETANNPADVFLMRPDTRFNNPLTNGGATRSITINLSGRKE